MRNRESLSPSHSEHCLPPLAGAPLLTAFILDKLGSVGSRGQQCEGATGSKNRAEDRAGNSFAENRCCTCGVNGILGTFF